MRRGWELVCAGRRGPEDLDGDGEVVAMMEDCFLPRRFPGEPLVLPAQPLIEDCLLFAIAKGSSDVLNAK